jgi:hypothetical protein
MNSLYYDYDTSVDLRWDNDMYGQFENEASEFRRKNNLHVTPPKKRTKKNNYSFLFRMFLWLILLLIIAVLVIKPLMNNYASKNADNYPFMDLTNRPRFHSFR